MKFNDLEDLMISRGVTTLAGIARALETTPQAVSNWKARDQVPHHIAYRLNNDITKDVAYKIENDKFESPKQDQDQQNYLTQVASPQITLSSKENNIFSFTDILLKITQQTKIIALVFFISCFFGITYEKFIKTPLYQSKATFLLPIENSNQLGNLSGLASQFGVNMPQNSQADLSSPSIIPELIRSRRFTEALIAKKFLLSGSQNSRPLTQILGGDSQLNKSEQIDFALDFFNKNLSFDRDPARLLSSLKITTNDPQFSKLLADSIISEIEKLNFFFKNKISNEKTKFIGERIKNVKTELNQKELNLKVFNERNQQITTPALQLNLDRLTRDVEVQRRIFLTLKEQLELARIEQIQESSVFQVVDRPQLPIGPYNINVKSSLILNSILGIVLGLLLALSKSYFYDNEDVQERKKIRKIKNSFIKKSKDFIFDYRSSGIVTASLFLALPFYISYESKNPVFFGKYSLKLTLFLALYVGTMILCAFVSFKSYKKKRN